MPKATIVASAAFFLVAAIGPSAQAPSPQTQRKPPAAQPAPASAPTIQTQTRLITVDVVVTGSHGKPIRGLTQEDFQISEEHAGQQKIAKFRFVDASASAPEPAR
ncbi:MAG: hypothetical protein ABR953_11800 [Candidatus Acidiferrales bacterium]|jgi:hypothetical protein